MSAATDFLNQWIQKAVHRAPRITRTSVQRWLVVRKLHAGVLVAATVVSVTAVTLVSRPAFAFTGSLIYNSSSFLCLQPVPPLGGNIGANGVRIAQTPCDLDNPAQGWENEPAGFSSDGRKVYYLVNDYNPNNRECLDVTDASSNDKAPIQQWFCNGGGSEKWIEVTSDIGTVQLINSRTGACVHLAIPLHVPERRADLRLGVLVNGDDERSAGQAEGAPPSSPLTWSAPPATYYSTLTPASLPSLGCGNGGYLHHRPGPAALCPQSKP
jgi:hypothetical protein